MALGARKINVGATAEQSQPKFAVRIYPPPRGVPDPRGDARLKKALQDMRLIPQDEPGDAKDSKATGDLSSSSAEMDRNVLKAKLESAKREAAMKEAQNKAGLIERLELYAAIGRVKVLEAELTGDPVQVAKARLLAAQKQSDVASQMLNRHIERCGLRKSKRERRHRRGRISRGRGEETE